MTLQLQTNNRLLTYQLKYFQNSYSANYFPSFQKTKQTKEKKHLDFSTKNTEDYNLPFWLTKLKQSFQKSNDCATSLDDVHYQLLTHLPDAVLSILLQMYNEICESGSFSPPRLDVVIIPLPKPGRKKNQTPAATIQQH